MSSSTVEINGCVRFEVPDSEMGELFAWLRKRGQEMTQHTNIDACCLICFNKFVTSQSALDKQAAKCPRCGESAVVEASDD